jgi:hypothetical protein
MVTVKPGARRSHTLPALCTHYPVSRHLQNEMQTIPGFHVVLQMRSASRILTATNFICQSTGTVYTKCDQKVFGLNFFFTLDAFSGYSMLPPFSVITLRRDTASPAITSWVKRLRNTASPTLKLLSNDVIKFRPLEFWKQSYSFVRAAIAQSV